MPTSPNCVSAPKQILQLSPGEYINIDFGVADTLTPDAGELYCLPPASTATSQGPTAGSSTSSEPGDNGDYTKMAFGVAATTYCGTPKAQRYQRVTNPTSGHTLFTFDPPGFPYNLRNKIKN
ncbi:hypothetical protein STEG23_037107 [Scotinomys teguina]